jgi:CheY-like chemotaxis protein
MVFGLVKQQRGFLDLASAPGKGTTVTLYLPRVATLAGAARPRLAPALVPVGDGALILLLEDDEPLRRTARRVLQRLGYRVLAAPDGVAGLDLFRAHAAEIALVIADVVMPGLTGPEVLAAVRRVSTGVPFLLSSGYSEREIATLDASATGVPVFRKPWTIEQLARRVRAMLDGAGGGGTPPAG